MARSREPFASLLLYHAFKWSVVAPTLRFYLRGHAYDLEKVPQTGPLIIVSNHASDFDPPLLSCCMRRPVAYMAKEELFKVPVLKQAITLYGAYPVKRGSADRSAIRSAMQAVKDGWAVGIFITGTRTPDGRVTAPKLGAALIAQKVQAPLLPVCLWGTDKIFQNKSGFPRPVPITVRVGELIPPPATSDRAELEVLTNRCADAINALHDLGR